MVKVTDNRGTPVIEIPTLKKGEFVYHNQFLFVGKGTNLLELAEALDTFDEKFLKDCGISPLSQ